MEGKKCAIDTREIGELLCDIADQVRSLIGDKGAVSVFRYAGKKLGKRIGSNHQGSAEDARTLVRAFFKDKEFMDGIDLEGTEALPWCLGSFKALWCAGWCSRLFIVSKYRAPI